MNSFHSGHSRRGVASHAHGRLVKLAGSHWSVTNSAATPASIEQQHEEHTGGERSRGAQRESGREEAAAEELAPYLVEEAVEDEAGAEEAKGEEQRHGEDGRGVRAADRHRRPRRRRHQQQQQHRTAVPPAGQSTLARAHADNVKGLDWVREQAVEGGSERPRRTDTRCSFPLFLLLLAQPRRRWEEETGTSKGGGQQDDAREGRRRAGGRAGCGISGLWRLCLCSP